MRGDLYDPGLYPGLVQGSRVNGEMYKIDDPKALDILDRFESFHPGDPDGSEYLRLLVDLIEPRQQAWAYFFYQRVKPTEPLI